MNKIKKINTYLIILASRATICSLQSEYKFLIEKLPYSQICETKVGEKWFEKKVVKKVGEKRG